MTYLWPREAWKDLLGHRDRKAAASCRARKTWGARRVVGANLEEKAAASCRTPKLVGRAIVPARMKGETDGVAAAIWTISAVVLLLIFLRGGDHPGLSDWTPPLTPVSRVDAEYATQWTLLEQAKPFIPPGSSFTVRSATDDSETSMFMLSQGILLRRNPLPWTYFGVKREEGAKTGYVIAQNPRVSHQADLVKAAGLKDGTVYRRIR